MVFVNRAITTFVSAILSASLHPYSFTLSSSTHNSLQLYFHQYVNFYMSDPHILLELD